jgi:tetratricopeptide (TPR) repeat protein
VLSFISCSKKQITTYSFNPPKNLEVAKYKEVAFLPFKGKNGDFFSLELEAKIKNLSINGKPIFKLIDRQNLKYILSEQKLSLSGFIDEKKAIKIGRLIGVKGIWTGAILKNKVNTYPFYEKRIKCLDKKCKNVKEYFVRCFKKEAVFSFVAKLLDVSTGEVVYSKKHEGRSYGKYCLDDGYTISSEELLSFAKNKAINSFLKDIAPYEVRYSIKIKDEIENVSEKDKELFESSLKWIEAKDINKACEIWSSLLKKYPKNITLLYNLGVCYEVKSDLKRAYKFYKKAYNLLYEPDEDIINSLKRVKNLLDKKEKLKKFLKR